MIPSVAMLPEIIWMAVCGLYDLSARRVPNWLFLVGGGLALVHIRASWHSQDVSVARFLLPVLHVALALLLWHWGLWGGADAKFWIVLAFLFPFNVLLAALLISQAIVAAYVAIQSIRQQQSQPLPGIPLMSAGLLLSPQLLSWIDGRG